MEQVHDRMEDLRYALKTFFAFLGWAAAIVALSGLLANEYPYLSRLIFTLAGAVVVFGKEFLQ